MKKIIKSTILSLLVCFSLIVSGCGCSKPKTYSNHGMTITMEKGFVEKSHINYTYYLEKSDTVMIAIKENFQTGLESDTTLTEYTNLVLRVNNHNGLTVETRDNSSYMYFVFEKNISGKDFYYLATTHKTSDSFWLIQFACEQKDKDEYHEKFLKWADTITFDSEN